MINLTDNAEKHLNDYLQQVRTCLKVCLSVDAGEVEQNIKEHIESELQGSSEPISYDALDAVLKKLGSPEQWVPEEDLSWWRKIILRLRKGPEDWRLAYISFGLLILSFLVGRMSFIVFVPASFIISRAVLSTVDQTNQLKGQRWLIYPSLFIVYTFVAFWLLLWPVFPLVGIADGMEHPRFIGMHDWSSEFPWNTNDIDLAYWPIAFLFIIAGICLWWFIAGLVYKKKPRLFQAVFYPFANRFQPKWIKWFTRISIGLLTICLAGGILMIKFHGWYYCLKRIFQ